MMAILYKWSSEIEEALAFGEITVKDFYLLTEMKQLYESLILLFPYAVLSIEISKLRYLRNTECDEITSLEMISGNKLN